MQIKKKRKKIFKKEKRAAAKRIDNNTISIRVQGKMRIGCQYRY